MLEIPSWGTVTVCAASLMSLLWPATCRDGIVARPRGEVDDQAVGAVMVVSSPASVNQSSASTTTPAP